MSAEPLIFKLSTISGAQALPMTVHEGWIDPANPEIFFWDPKEKPKAAEPFTHLDLNVDKLGLFFPGHHRSEQRWNQKPTDDELELLKTLAAYEIINVEMIQRPGKRELESNTRRLRLLERGRGSAKAQSVRLN